MVPWSQIPKITGSQVPAVFLSGIVPLTRHLSAQRSADTHLNLHVLVILLLTDNTLTLRLCLGVQAA